MLYCTVMKKQLEQLIEFHKTFGAFYQTALGDIDEPTRNLRIALMREELKEVEDAMHHEPIENIAKEIADILYVTYGTIVAYGLQDKMEAVFDEVHRSNMSKFDAQGAITKREDGKILKSDTYTPPDIAAILK